MEITQQLYKFLPNRRRQDRSSLTHIQNIVPLMIIAAGLLIGGSVAGYMWSNYRIVRLQALEKELEYVGNSVRATLMVRASTIQRMANRWNAEGGIAEEVWYADAADQMKDFPALTILNWIDRDMVVQYNLADPRFPDMVGKTYVPDESRKEALNRVVSERKSYFSVPRVSSDRPELTTLVISYPVFVNGEFDGFLLGIVNIKQLYDSILARLVNNGYTVMIQYGDETFYHAGQDPKSLDPEWSRYKDVELASQTWTITIWPDIETISSQGLGLPFTLFFGTLMLSIVLARSAKDGIRLTITNKGLIAARLHAETETLQKSRFLSAASHDLREPANAASLILDTVIQRLPSSENRDQLTRVQHALASQKRGFDNILNLARIESGKVEPNIQDVHINDVFDNLATIYRDTAADLGHNLRVVPSNAIIRTDPELLTLILSNFLLNAVRHTDRGDVLLGCLRQGWDLKIGVWDTGRGIKPDQVKDIFKELSRAPDNINASELGPRFGLGLSISQRLAALLGHKLGVHSELGKGSCFYCVVPRIGFSTAKVSNAELGSTTSPETSVTTKKKIQSDILVIDDDQMTLDSLNLALTSKGFKVTTAKTVSEAVLAVSQGGCSPDVIVADYYLSGRTETGMTAIQNVRQVLRRQIPAIIVTGETAAEVQHEIAEADYVLLEKPIRLDALVDHINAALNDAAIRVA